MRPEKVDHICFAVKSLEQAVPDFNRLLEIEPFEYYSNEDEKLRVARYQIGEVFLELMEDTTGDGDVAKFIERKGEGFFLISFKVADSQAALDRAREKGFRAIDQSPRPWRNSRYGFLHPEAAHGVLVEFIDEKE